uniref:mitogen-activated protein kinase kinase n=1 Tax=Phallusia mammillata TaxID=59560 RepID=A0A6F9DKQ6_9ASCI|nr:MAPKK7 dual specificity mitogen-activated protein kinase kinase 7 [Phallusia mammillata]
MSGNVASGTVNLSDLEERLKKLESNFQSKKRPTNKLGLNFGAQPNHPTVPAQRPQMSLNFQSSAPASTLNSMSQQMAQPRKKQISFSIPPPEKSHESERVNQRLQEVYQQTGKLRIGGKVLQAHVHEFDNLGQIGSGTCGQVYKMRYKPISYVMAVKQMNRSGNNDEQKRILMDLDIVQKSHDCPTIVTCFGTFVTESSVWICMELMETCFEKLKKRVQGPMPEVILGKLTVAVVQALNYLKEQHNVIHRDVKPSNILVGNNGVIKLCDFGISGRLVDSQAKTRAAGCTAYMAPERISPDPNHPNYDIRADVWSLGISLVELATGRFPYSDCKTDFEMLTKILEQEPPSLPPDKGFSIHFQKFVTACCTKDYRNRPKYRELLADEFVKRFIFANVDVTKWLGQILYPPTGTTAFPIARTASGNVVKPTTTDPFAFAAEITQAQFAKHARTRSLDFKDFNRKPGTK